MRKLIVLLALAIASTLLEAKADGIPFRTFRTSRVAVPATVLSLTKEQMASLTTSNNFITLTSEQRARLHQDVSYVPDRLKVWSSKDARGTCTCEVLNLGIRYAKGKIEVPHGLLGRTLQDRKFWN